MNSGEDKSVNVPPPPTLVPSPTATQCPTGPPKRFLTCTASRKISGKVSIPAIGSPPKLFQSPSVVLTPVDASKATVEIPCSTETPGKILVNEGEEEQTYPPPPPLIKMPSRRKETTTTVDPVVPPETITASGRIVRKRNGPSESDSVAGEEVSSEPSRKRTRTAVAEKCVGSTTPRKIIQEIFGPDKSKKAKGKGRKKRRGGAPTPKKKVLADNEDDGDDDVSSVIDKDENVEDDQEENEDNVKDTDATENAEEGNTLTETTETHTSQEIGTGEVTQVREDEDEEVKHTEGEVSGNPDQSGVDVEEEEITKPVDKNEACLDVNFDSEEESVVFRSPNRRKAKSVANERLKRLSQDGNSEDKDQAEKQLGEKSGPSASAGSVQSRRSTNDSSKSESSSNSQQDSEGSAPGTSRNTQEDNQQGQIERGDGTPSSVVSEEEDDDEDEGGGDDDETDDGAEDGNQEQKDSDMDSVYSWKPVRAAAAIALEQVTKNQSSGSTGLPGDAEAKAAAAAERRARKVNRYKGRSRRSLLFKNSSSKKFTTQKLNRYSAQPTIQRKVFHNGRYFQPGDLVWVPLADDSPIYGQIRGLLRDQYGEISAGIRFLAPKHPVYAFMKFDPINYAFRYDIPEKLIKIAYVNFIMNLNLDHFDGHPSFRKIEKYSIYTRMGRSLQEGYESQCARDFEERQKNASMVHSDSSSSDSEEEDKKKNESLSRRRHLSDSSSEDESKEKTENQDKPDSDADGLKDLQCFETIGKEEDEEEQTLDENQLLATEKIDSVDKD